MVTDHVYDLLKRMAADGTHAVYLRPPCTPAQIRILQTEAQELLGEELPSSITRLLSLSNGCQINNAYFSRSEELLPKGAVYPQQKRFINLGDDETASFVFDREIRRFHIMIEGSSTPGDPGCESFAALEDLLLRVMEEQGIEFGGDRD